MSVGAAYLLAHLLAVLPGLIVLPFEPVRSWRWPAKAAAAFAVGSVVLAAAATLAALLRVPEIVPFLLAASPLVTLGLLRRRSVDFPPTSARPRSAVTLFSMAASASALGSLAAGLVAGRSTSVDFLLFWGAKAVRFAETRAIDPVALADRFFVHARPFYPPLVPVVDAMAVLVAGGMPWRVAPLSTLLWCGAGALLVLEPLRRLDAEMAPLVAAFWTAAIAASLGASYSGGSAEAPLILFVSAAGTLLMTERRDDPARRRWLAGAFLAGAVLTKVEGSVASLLLLLGVVLRDRLADRARPRRDLVPLFGPPLLGGGLWLAFIARFGLAIDSPGRGRLFDVDLSRLARAIGPMAKGLEAGTWWLSWAIPLVVLLWVASRACLRQTLPALLAIAGSFAFFLGIYLHETGDLSQRIGWELPRLSQPALSLLIVAAGVASLGQPRRLAPTTDSQPSTANSPSNPTNRL